MMIHMRTRPGHYCVRTVTKSRRDDDDDDDTKFAEIPRNQGWSKCLCADQAVTAATSLCHGNTMSESSLERFFNSHTP
jgi:hypothetical protein